MKKRILIIIAAAALFVAAGIVYGYKIGILGASAKPEEEPEPFVPEPMPTEREFAIEGRYFDSVSGLAYLKIEKTEESGEGYEATVMWGPAAENFNEWTMTLFDDSDGHLCYNDCVKQHIEVDEAGNITAEVLYEGGEGYFTVGNWLLKWDGAEDESCRSCIFEK